MAATFFAVPGTLCVRDYGTAANGTTDDTAAFQAALDAASALAFRKVVVPPGVYLIAGNLTIPPGVVLEGAYADYVGTHSQNYDAAWFAGYDMPYTPATPLYTKPGTTLLLTAGSGNASGTPHISMTGSNSGLRGFTLFWPNQSVSATTPTAYPWAVKITKGNNNVVRNVELLNCYQGIWLEYAFRSMVRNVHGQALSKGILAQGGADVSRFENVHFGPWWAYQTGPYTWMLANLTAYEFGRNDLMEWHNCFAFGCNIGIQLSLDTAHNLSGPDANWGHFNGGGIDVANTCILINQTQPEPTTFTGLHLTNTSGGYCVDFGTGFSGDVNFSGCYGLSSAGTYARVRGTGSVGFQGGSWKSSLASTVASPATPAGIGFDCSGGMVSLTGMRFLDTQTHIRFQSGTTRAVATGNVSPAGTSVTNSISTAATVGNNG